MIVRRRRVGSARVRGGYVLSGGENEGGGMIRRRRGCGKGG
jgi:hypothetical protein